MNKKNDKAMTLFSLLTVLVAFFSSSMTTFAPKKHLLLIAYHSYQINPICAFIKEKPKKTFVINFSYDRNKL